MVVGIDLVQHHVFDVHKKVKADQDYQQHADDVESTIIVSIHGKPLVLYVVVVND